MKQDTEISANPKAMAEIPCIKITRGMPRWRAAQREMPVADKIELIGKFIQETRQLERLKKSCKLSAISSNNSSSKGS